MAEASFTDEHVEVSNVKVDWEIWKKIFSYVGPYRRDLLYLVIVSAAVGLIDVLIPLLTRWVIEDVEANGANASFAFWGTLYVCLVFLLSVGSAAFTWLCSKLRVHGSHNIRRDAFHNLQRQSYAFFDHRPVGWLVARLTSDVERLTNIVAWGSLDFLWGCTIMICITTALFWMHWQLALMVMLVLPLIHWLTVKFRRSILSSARDVRSTNSRITGQYNESIMGVQTAKAYVREQANLGEFQDLTNQMYRSSVRNLTLSALYVPALLIVSSISFGITLAYGGSELLAGAIGAGALVAFILLVRYFYDPIEIMGYWYTEMQMAQAAAERVLGVIDAKPAIQDSSNVLELVARHRTFTPRDGIADDGGDAHISSISLRQVSFGYESDETVLHDINLEVSAGESIALVGPTGGGKSTLVNVICRFYEPTSGQILLNGVDYRQRSLHWLHSNLGMVLQEAHVFGGSIYDNIRYGRLDATREDVLAASHIAGAHDFIVALSEGYDTPTGERGGLLSSGQKQLISLARAILADPQLLILDEATSAIDTETEQQIQSGIEKLLSGRISFVVAHRLSTIRNADRILFIDEGRIVEEGTHRQLLAKQGRYFELYSQQSLDTSFLESMRTHEVQSVS